MTYRNFTLVANMYVLLCMGESKDKTGIQLKCMTVKMDTTDSEMHR